MEFIEFHEESLKIHADDEKRMRMHKNWKNRWKQWNFNAVPKNTVFERFSKQSCLLCAHAGSSLASALNNIQRTTLSAINPSHEWRSLGPYKYFTMLWYENCMRIVWEMRPPTSFQRPASSFQLPVGRETVNQYEICMRNLWETNGLGVGICVVSLLISIVVLLLS